ncbi:MAG: xanthine/uracil permease [Defluviitaleaceae bacterium]|nr:xanthine/uracil permease [Defluviitaleaceae bacterium]
MFQDLSVFVIAVIFVAINGLTMLAWAAAQGYKMKPTAFAFLVGAVGNLLTGSITPISGQSSILTVSHFMKNVNERIAALLLAVLVMIPLGLTGAVTRIADFAGPAVVNGMMAGVGLMVAGISLDMLKQNRRTAAIAFIGALATHVAVPRIEWLDNRHALVYVIAVSVTLATLDFVFLQTDPETGKKGRRIDIIKASKADGYEGDMEQNENPKFWTKEYWEDFKLMKPKFGFYAFYFALAFISLNIGTNIAFGNITAGFGARDAYGALLNPQNMDHLTVINSIADIPSVLFGGAPVGAIISATAAAPWPVMAGVVMMLLCALLLFLGLMTKAVKYIPVQAIAGFLFIIGFFSTFVPNLRNALGIGVAPINQVAEISYAMERAPMVAAALAITALTKNPFLGLVAGIAVRYIGSWFGL